MSAGNELIGPLADRLRQRGLTVAVAESCTGGLLAGALTELAGSSDFFLGGLVTYANQAKMDLLGVPEAVIRELGAVSADVARLMAEGARRVFGSDLGIGVTGIAGPAAEGSKPVGLTFIAAQLEELETVVREYNWSGERGANREASVEAALRLASEVLSRQLGNIV